MDGDLNKLKVVDLRKELQSRGLDTKGLKTVLVERLKKALQKEKAPKKKGAKAKREEVEESEAGDSNSETELDNTAAQVKSQDDLDKTTVPVESDHIQNENDDNVIDHSNSESIDNKTKIEETELSTNDDERNSKNNSFTENKDDGLNKHDQTSQDVNIEITEQTSENQSPDEIASDTDHPMEVTEKSGSDSSVQNDNLDIHPKETSDVPELESNVSIEENPLTDETKSVNGDENDESTKIDDKESEEIDEQTPMDTGEGESSTEQIPVDVVVSADINEKDTVDSVDVDKKDSHDSVSISEENTAESVEINEKDTHDSPNIDEENTAESVDRNEKDTVDADTDQVPIETTEGMIVDEEKSKLNDESVPEKSELNDESVPEKSKLNDESVPMDTTETEETAPNTDESVKPAKSEEPRKRVRKSRFDQPEDNANLINSESSERNQMAGRKRRHSPSPAGDSYEAPAKIVKQDNEPSFDDNLVLLSWYDSDLNMNIEMENFVKGSSLSDSDFKYLSAGARCTFGFNSSKIYFDVKVIEKNAVSAESDFEIFTFRIGCSVIYSSLRLGEVPLSYGYDSSGKKCVDDVFEEYGKPFNAGDIVGCLIDFDSDEKNVIISFTLNNSTQSTAFEVSKELLEGKSLFPHVLSKNYKFEINFGEREECWELDEKFDEDFTYASKVSLEQRTKGPRKPEDKKSCEVVMMCGLPSSGKTTWVKKHVAENSEKMYNVISVDETISKMKVLNEPFQNIYKESKTLLLQMCTKLTDKFHELGSIRWRNYILDQTNLPMYIQRKTMQLFEGFTRNAVVILPNDVDYQKYSEKMEENPLRDTKTSLNDMKSTFRLPEVGELFDKVTIEGCTPEEANELVKKYNREGREARTPRTDDRSSNRYSKDDRYGSGRQSSGGTNFREKWGNRLSGSMGRGSYRPTPDRMPPRFNDRRGFRDSRGEDDYHDFGKNNRYPPRDNRHSSGGMNHGGGGGGGGGNKWNRDNRHSGPPQRMGGMPHQHRGPQSFDDGPNRMMNEDRKRYSRMGEGTPSAPYGGGFRGGRVSGSGYQRGNGRPDDGGRSSMGGDGRFGASPFRPNHGPPRGGGPTNVSGGYGRGGGGRDDGGRFQHGGRGGGRDIGESRNTGGPPRGGGGGSGRRGGRFDDRDVNKSSGNGNGNQQSPWSNSSGGSTQQQTGQSQGGAQNNWNPYQNWPLTQYPQVSGYSPQQLQYLAQYQAAQSQQAGGGGGPATGGSSSNSGSNPKSGSNSSVAGYDPSAYASYAQYYAYFAQQGWKQNADGTYAPPHGDSGGSNNAPPSGNASTWPSYYNAVGSAGATGASTGNKRGYGANGSGAPSK